MRRPGDTPRRILRDASRHVPELEAGPGASRSLPALPQGPPAHHHQRAGRLAGRRHRRAPVSTRAEEPGRRDGQLSDRREWNEEALSADCPGKRHRETRWQRNQDVDEPKDVLSWAPGVWKLWQSVSISCQRVLSSEPLTSLFLLALVGFGSMRPKTRGGFAAAKTYSFHPTLESFKSFHLSLI